MKERFFNKRGISFIEVIVAIGLISLLFGSIYLSYYSVLDVVSNSELRVAAATLVNEEIEVIRNLPYESVGTVGGVPAGVLPLTKTVAASIGQIFSLTYVVRNIDDPFDGVIGGTPNDTAPADYKLIEIRAACVSCARFTPITLTTTVAPQGLESASSDGSLFINVFDGSGVGVSGATVQVVNVSTTPTINLVDTTNASGVLQLVGVPTSTQSYAITISKSGYSSERTYAPGSLGNPNPLPEYTHATVQAQTLTSASFAIDRVSTVTVYTSDQVCAPFVSEPFAISGAKIIGNPNVLKFTTSSITNASGERVLTNIEWDTYTFSLSSSSYDVAGTIPFSPLVVNANTNVSFRFVLAAASPRALMVAVKDALSGAAIPSSTVEISSGGFSETKKTARGMLLHTSWTESIYDSQSGLDMSDPDEPKMLFDNGYSTTTTAWLVSKTFDVGGSASSYYTLSWAPTTQAPQTGANSLRFQLASNNDNSTWNFVGPDGTASSYYTSSGANIRAAHSGDRYLRYKAFFNTEDENYTPELDEVEISFFATCVSPAHVLFQNLSAATYDLQVSASGYEVATTSVSVSSAWQKVEVELTPS